MPTVGEGREGWFMFLFVVQALVWLGLLVWYEIAFRPGDNALGTAIAVAKGMAPLIVVVAADTVVMVEGYEMLAEKYLRRRYEAGRKEGRDEIQELWEAWNQRRLEAEADGKEFAEPPPTLARSEHSS